MLSEPGIEPFVEAGKEAENHRLAGSSVHAWSDMVAQAFSPRTQKDQEGRSQLVQGQPALYTEFQSSQGYIERSCLEENNNKAIQERAETPRKSCSIQSLAICRTRRDWGSWSEKMILKGLAGSWDSQGADRAPKLENKVEGLELSKKGTAKTLRRHSGDYRHVCHHQTCGK